jgi:2,3-dihydroxybenzoate decarboxylase
MIHGHTHGSFLDEKKYWVIFEAAQALDAPAMTHGGISSTPAAG